MNQCSRLVAVFSLIGCSAHAEPNPLLPPVTWKTIETNVVLDVGRHHRTMGRVKHFTDANGNSYSTTNKITELATGMHYNENGVWKESEASFEIVNGYAVAGKLGHRLVLAPDINTEGAVDFTTTDGKRMRSHVVGVGYRDRKTGESVLLGEITNSVGWVVSPNQAVYSNCFNGLSCSLRYTVTRGGMEQDLIFHEAPDVSEFNFESGELELYSEFLEVPEPLKSITYTGEQGAQVANENLSFGAMEIGEGYAFLADGTNDKGDQHAVTKWFGVINGRKLLIESLPYGGVAKELAGLKPQAKTLVNHTVTRERKIPLLVKSISPGNMQFAKSTATTKSPEFVLDYSLSGFLTDQAFRSDTTYFITGDVSLDGTTTFEGGAVIKYTNDVSIAITSGAVNFLTEPYRPVVFTALDDNSVGDTISGSTGTPTGTYAYSALNITTTNVVAADNIRVKYAKIGLQFGLGLNHVVQNSQILNCERAVVASRTAIAFRNDLFYNNTTNFYFGFSGPVATCENVTFHLSDKLSFTSLSGNLILTNCIVAAVTNWGNSSVVTNKIVVLSSDAGLFKTVGAASHYLADGSIYRNYGNPNISSATAALLKKRTTFAPIFLGTTGSPIYWGNTNISMFPQASRDTDTPDLGYHYDPIDYVLGGIYATNCAFTASVGTVISAATETANCYGIALHDSSSLVVAGNATNKCYFVEYNTVQEQSNTNWAKNKATLVFTAFNQPVTSPVSTFSFTDFCLMDYAIFGFNGGNYYSGLTPTVFTDCQFKGGQFQTQGANFNATNCLFVRIPVTIYTSFASATNIVVLRNCLFYQGGFHPFFTGDGNINCYDCQFDAVDNSGVVAGTVYNDYNAYTTNMFRLSPNGSNDLLANSFSYNTGTLGAWYQPTNSTLINAGNVSDASTKGFYHYTTTTNQTKEATSVLDIGFHYVATDGSGNPLDNDSDGIPDYLEDRNGNGVFDATEDDWQSTAKALYILITEPKRNLNIP